jgi:hypothetical protein
VSEERILPVRSQRLFASYMDDVLMSTSQSYGDFCLLIYGSPNAALLQRCAESFKNIVVHGNLPAAAPENCWPLSDFSDRMHFDLSIGAALLLCPPSTPDAQSIDQLLRPEGVLITAGHFPRLQCDLPSRAILKLDPNHAYRGQMERWVAIANLMKSAQSRSLAIQ